MQTIELTENETEQTKLALLCYRQELSFVNMRNAQRNTRACEIAICNAILNKLGYDPSDCVTGTKAANQ